MSADSDDPFILLGLPRRFNLAPEAVEAAYLTHLAALHPDRVAATGDAFANNEAGSVTARLNQARDTLADDERRANALLTLVGGPSKEQDKSLPDGFLIDMMEIRQEMEQVLARGSEDDEVGADADRKRLQAWAQEERQMYVAHVANLFAQLEPAQNDADGTSGDRSRAELRHAIRRKLNAWRYIERMLEQLDPDYRGAL